MEIYGNSWKPIEFLGNLWKSMEIHVSEIPWGCNLPLDDVYASSEQAPALVVPTRVPLM